MRQGESFDAVFHEHFARVLAYSLRRVPSRHEADDVVAETFAIAWRRRDAMPDPPLPWLYGVAAGVIRNQRRSSRRLARLRGKLRAEPIVLRPDLVDSIGERDAFAEAFSQISEGQREVLRLVAWEGLDNRDAAAVLDCSETAFKVRLHRARRDLAKRMEQAGHIEDEMPGPTQLAARPKPE